MYVDFYTYLLYRYGINDFRVEKDDEPVLGLQYMIEEGDDLYDIAKRFHTTVNQLKALNNLSTDLIHPGQIIMINDSYSPGRVDEFYKTYIVREGDTIYSIAYQYNMTVLELKDLNSLLSDEVSIGQELIVRNVPEELTDERIYTVKKGDSLYTIANRYHTTVERIKQLNDLSSNELDVGQQLKIYDNKNETGIAGTKVYVVMPGDNIYRIASKNGTTVKRIKALNHMKSNLLYIGQELLIPN